MFPSAFSSLDLNESISNGAFNTTLGDHSSLMNLIVNNNRQLFSLTSIFSDVNPGSQLYCSKFSAHLSPWGLHPSDTYIA